ncbi:iron-sulfur cluster assembly scaffold protein [Desulfogranum japonicum]|uniref:iron-sulfur cluster assembly scaffold protein n=1 Tax=Desulfogranum japonicum TaxID=231447 RepID=UPI0004019D88|nr:iron-sulfur cluster assembly scaffold protein [Desulfogranum japonicum]
MDDAQFHAMVDSIQEKVFQDAEEAYGAVGFDRWRNPRFNGVIDIPDATGCITGDCGDTMKIFLQFEQDTVSNASYITDGCASSSICGSFAAEMAIGKTIEQIFDLTGDDILNHLGQFPKNETHCAFLAVKTLQEAVNQYMIKQTRQK